MSIAIVVGDDLLRATHRKGTFTMGGLGADPTVLRLERGVLHRACMRLALRGGRKQAALDARDALLQLARLQQPPCHAAAGRASAAGEAGEAREKEEAAAERREEETAAAAAAAAGDVVAAAAAAAADEESCWPVVQAVAVAAAAFAAPNTDAGGSGSGSGTAQGGGGTRRCGCAIICA